MSSSRTFERASNAGIIAAATGFVNAAFSYFAGYAQPSPQAAASAIPTWNATQFSASVSSIVDANREKYIYLVSKLFYREFPEIGSARFDSIFYNDRNPIYTLTMNFVDATINQIKCKYEDLTAAYLLDLTANKLITPILTGPSYQIAATMATAFIVSYYLLSGSNPEIVPVEEAESDNANSSENGESLADALAASAHTDHEAAQTGSEPKLENNPAETPANNKPILTKNQFGLFQTNSSADNALQQIRERRKTMVMPSCRKLRLAEDTAQAAPRAKI